MSISKKLSKTMKSVLLTKGLTTKYDDRQQVPESGYITPPAAVRFLAASLVFEECKELLKAMGFTIHLSSGGTLVLQDAPHGHISDVIDGACDLDYVTLGVLAAYGVPDKPHMKAVCKANEAKFPGGEVTYDKATGKYLKPAGWKPPDHDKAMGKGEFPNFQKVTKKLVDKFIEKPKKKSKKG